ncbi:MAG: RidA family protein [Deltaproteobacteria bacterium]
MPKKEIVSKKAPAAIGPYSQAVRAGGLVFASGQIPVEPVAGETIKGPIQLQTRQVLHNLEMILKEAGLSMDHVVKTTVYLKDMTHFVDMNGVYGEFFSPPYPARATVQVSALPKGVLIEIDAIALAEKDS